MSSNTRIIILAACAVVAIAILLWLVTRESRKRRKMAKKAKSSAGWRSTSAPVTARPAATFATGRVPQTVAQPSPTAVTPESATVSPFQSRPTPDQYWAESDDEDVVVADSVDPADPSEPSVVAPVDAAEIDDQPPTSTATTIDPLLLMTVSDPPVPPAVWVPVLAPSTEPDTLVSEGKTQPSSPTTTPNTTPPGASAGSMTSVGAETASLPGPTAVPVTDSSFQSASSPSPTAAAVVEVPHVLEVPHVPEGPTEVPVDSNPVSPAIDQSTDENENLEARSLVAAPPPANPEIPAPLSTSTSVTTHVDTLVLSDDDDATEELIRLAPLNTHDESDDGDGDGDGDRNTIRIQLRFSDDEISQITLMGTSDGSEEWLTPSATGKKSPKNGKKNGNQKKKKKKKKKK